MIRINLLPVRKTKQRETVQQQLIAFMGVLLVTMVLCFAWWQYKNKEVEDLERTIAAKEQEIKQLDKIIGEVNEFTTKKDELEEKLKVINDLKKGKTGPVRALDDLASEIPKRVWLEKIEEQGGSLKFEGKAIDHEDVSAFMKALQKSKYFSGVRLNYSKDEKLSTVGDTAVIYQFEITATVNYAS